LRRKILPHASLAPKKKIARRRRSRHPAFGLARLPGVGFTNGCFDILHPGHVKVLTAARGACDR